MIWGILYFFTLLSLVEIILFQRKTFDLFLAGDD
jgi:hypothetical protein